MLMLTSKNNVADRITVGLLFIYLAALVWIIIFKMNVQFSYMEHHRGINLIPYNEPHLHNGRPDVGELILNALIFVPLGIYIGVLFKSWGTVRKIFVFFLTSLGLETVQYMLAMGASDITDVINNTMGGIMGLIFYKIIAFVSPRHAQTIINVLAALATMSILGLLFYAKINKLYMFRR